MKTPKQITDLLSPELTALGEVHGALGQRIAEAFTHGELSIEETVAACSIVVAFLDMLQEDPVEIGLTLIAKALDNDAQVKAFRDMLDDLPDAA